MPPHVSAEQVFRLLQVEVANLRAILGYAPGQFDGDLVYFRCTERTNFGEYSDLFFSLAETDHASTWGGLCASVRVYDVPELAGPENRHRLLVYLNALPCVWFNTVGPKVQIRAERLEEQLS